MNVVNMTGRLTDDPEIKYTTGEKPLCIASYSIAVNRPFTDKDGNRQADFFTCKSFGKTGEFVEKYVKKGTKVVVRSHYQSGSYTNRDGQKVYTHDFVVDDIEFAESKAAASQNQQTAPTGNNINDYVNAIPGIDESLPFA